MKVEFSIDEVVAMAEAVIDGVGTVKLNRKDAAALRRWRNKVVTSTSPELTLLTEKLNREIQRAHDTARKSGIVKPDWA